MLRNYEINALSKLRQEFGDFVEVVQVDDHIHIYVRASDSLSADEILSVLLPEQNPLKNSKESEKQMAEQKTVPEAAPEQKVVPEVKASAWYDQLLPLLISILPQILDVLTRMIGVQISTETKKMTDEVSTMKAEVEKKLDEHLTKQKAELEKLQKRQEQILQDLDAKIAAKAAALDNVLSVLVKAGNSLSEVKK